ncbi:MAG TPA: carbohydrate kinase [Saprospiraceae bacterium]|nr:carbohydrate kinase [Saprospiraceae bacterium]
MPSTKQTIICFGEILWDMLPAGKLAGGAPMNVAFHLNRLGEKVFPLTALGRDELGRELMEFLKSKNIPTGLIQWNSYPTGKVLVKLNEKNEATYTIEYPSAWDHIEWTESIATLFTDQSPVLVYGSLACRHEVSRNTLERLLPGAAIRICDINLRAPFYSEDLIHDLLSKADWIKINHEELDLINSWNAAPEPGEQDQVQQLFAQYPRASLILVTRGGDGAACYEKNSTHDHPGFKVEVQDTIGSGDSFLAMFISRKLSGFPLQVCLEDACALGAVVAKYPGATAIFDAESEVKKLKELRKLN